MTQNYPAQAFKDKKFSVHFHKLMVRTRVLEERLITMVKSGEGHFWIGGPGEEAFSTSLGLLANKGEGLAHDYLHLHYRSNGVLMAMGEPMISFIRQMASVVTDPFSGGRNFASHICKREWNVVPVTSTIETQFSVAPGTAMAQKTVHDQEQDAGVTVVVGGDAGTAEGDFATALVWSSRPGAELPMLMIVTNNQYGISTPAETQHGEKNIADRAKAFGIQTQIVDGNQTDKVWNAVRDALESVRETRKPFLLEIKVSRLHGHSSSSGANRMDEECPIVTFEKKLIKQDWLSEDEIQAVWKEARDEAQKALDQARQEPEPEPQTVYQHSFWQNTQPFFMGGLPGKDI